MVSESMVLELQSLNFKYFIAVVYSVISCNMIEFGSLLHE
jgi:hypothetical protein